MFRRLESSLPKDFEFPHDLKGLGYYINEKDQIRSIKDHDQDFHYFISKNERVNEVQREAMNTCIRRNVMSRLLSPSLTITRLPIGSSADTNHVPILTSSNLSDAKRIILYIGESSQDLGIFAYRVIGQETIASGSAIDFVREVQSCPDDPGLLIANPGQLIWHRRGKQAMTPPTWYALPMKTAVSAPMRLDEVKNRVPQNETVPKHIKYVFEEVLGKMADKAAKIHVIAVGDSALEMVSYIQEEWDKWEARIEAIAIGASYIWVTEFFNERFQEFWGKRARAYLLSSADLDYPVTGRDDFGCNCYSAGEFNIPECIMPRAHTAMLRYFQMVSDNPHFESVAQDVPQPIPAEDGVQVPWAWDEGRVVEV